MISWRLDSLDPYFDSHNVPLKRLVCFLIPQFVSLILLSFPYNLHVHLLLRYSQHCCFHWSEVQSFRDQCFYCQLETNQVFAWKISRFLASWVGRSFETVEWTFFGTVIGILLSYVLAPPGKWAEQTRWWEPGLKFFRLAKRIHFFLICCFSLLWPWGDL